MAGDFQRVEPGAEGVQRESSVEDFSLTRDVVGRQAVDVLERGQQLGPNVVYGRRVYQVLMVEAVNTLGERINGVFFGKVQVALPAFRRRNLSGPHDGDADLDGLFVVVFYGAAEIGRAHV